MGRFIHSLHELTARVVQVGAVAALAAIALPWAAPAVAGPPATLAVEVISVDDSRFPEVTAVVNVLDEANRPIIGLTAADMLAEEGGEPAAITSVERATDADLGIGVVLAVDTSGSMNGSSLDEARAAALAFLESLAPGDEAAVIAFSDEVRIVQPMTSDHEALRAALESLQAGGNTALHQAVVDSIDTAAASPLPRRIVVLLSDGEDFGNVSRATRSDAVWKAALTGVPVYSIGLGSSIDEAFLSEIATQARGGLLIAPSASDVAANYAQVAELLRSQYLVTLTSSAESEIEVRGLTVTVTTATGAGSGGLIYESARGGAIATPSATATSTATPRPTATPATPTEDGGGFDAMTVLLPIFGIAAVAVAGGYGYSWMQRRQRQVAEDRMLVGASSYLRPLPATDTVALPPLRAEIIAGDADAGDGVSIGADPVLIGSGDDCDLRLPAASNVAERHARLWWRDSTLILQHIAPGFTTTANGEPVRLRSLALNDEFGVGEHRIRIVADRS